MATKTQFTFRPMDARQILEPRLWNETNTYVDTALDEIFLVLSGSGGSVVASSVLQKIVGENATQSLAIVNSQTSVGLLPRSAMIFHTLAGVTNSSSFIVFMTNLDGNSRVEQIRITELGLLAFKGGTSGHPALRRNGSTLEVRRADDSAEGALSASTFTEGGTLLSNKYALLAGAAFIGDVSIISLAAVTQLMRSDAVTRIDMETFSATNAPSIRLFRSRGTAAAPTDVAQNDIVTSYEDNARLSGAFSVVGRKRVTATAATPSSTARDTRYVIELGVGSSLTEIMRLEHATGLSLFGTNSVIDQSRHRIGRSYTIATLPTANVAGEVIQVSDLGGGSGSVESTGASSAWRRRTPGYGTLGNADATVTVLTEAEQLNVTATLTANRVLTLSATRAYVGARFVIRRTGLGAFTLTVDNHNGTDLFVFAIGVGGTAIFVYNGTDWVFMGNMT